MADLEHKEPKDDEIAIARDIMAHPLRYVRELALLREENERWREDLRTTIEAGKTIQAERDRLRGDLAAEAEKTAIACGERDEANGEAEQLRVQLAGVLTALDGHYPDPPCVQGDYGWTFTYDTAMRVQRERDEAVALLRDILSTKEDIDPRMRYVACQIDRETLAQCEALTRKRQP